MVSSEWGSPNAIKKGFSLDDVGSGLYGQSIHIWDWSNRRHQKAIDLGPEGLMPLEVRFLHNPQSHHGYVGCALSSTLFHFFPEENTHEWTAVKVYSIPTKSAQNWIKPEMPALVTDILISMDDRFLYMSCWLHGEIHQLSLADVSCPILTAKVVLGGSPYLTNPSASNYEGLCGGPQMLQLSLDGRRLYVTTSLYSTWDQQCYPEMVKKGSDMLLVDICDDGRMAVSPSFRVDFGAVESGPLLAHEMRYPGGDCTSDIWL